MRLRTVSPHDPGWTRRRAGRGFVYLDASGQRLGGDEVERIKALVIPPAWQDVWICPYATGHVQAVGTDAAGRRQYLYHPEWRRQRDAAKFDHVIDMAKRLPQARRRFAADLAGTGLERDRVLAASVRLLDVGYFRIGSDVYADEHGSYGLTTLERRHVRKQGDCMLFAFVGKSGIEHEVIVDDPELCGLVSDLRRRRGGDDRLLAFKTGSRWRPVVASDVNDYLRESFEFDVTAKDFRTWHATVIAAEALADQPAGTTKAARRKAIRSAVVEVSDFLGNTPAIARSSYVDPRIIDLYDNGTTIAPTLHRAPKDPARRQEVVEKAVLRMLTRAPKSTRRA